MSSERITRLTDDQTHLIRMVTTAALEYSNGNGHWDTAIPRLGGHRAVHDRDTVRRFTMILNEIGLRSPRETE